MISPTRQSRNQRTTPAVSAPAPVKGRVVTGNSDVAYALGGVPGADTRSYWTSLTPAKAKSQKETDAAVSTQKVAIEAKKATDLANQKQAADAAKGVVNDTVANKAAIAARDAVVAQNGGNKTFTITAVVVGFVAALLAGWFYLKRKHKTA